MVRAKGLEPPRVASPGPKPGASTNSATLALLEGLPQTTPACLLELEVAAGRLPGTLKLAELDFEQLFGEIRQRLVPESVALHIAEIDIEAGCHRSAIDRASVNGGVQVLAFEQVF